MCVSNNFVEQEAYEFTKKIRECSQYKFIKLDLSKNIINSNNGRKDNGLDLITKVILEDKDGTLYSVEPNSNGLRFAKKEITFKEYKKLQNRDSLNIFVIFFGLMGLLIVLMLTFVRYLT